MQNIKSITVIITEQELTEKNQVDCNIKIEFKGKFPGGVPEMIRFLGFAIDDLKKISKEN